MCIVILLPFSPISRPDSIRSAENLTLTSDWVKKFYTSFGQRYKTQRGEMTASNTVFTVFSGIGIIISIIPLWWHLESWNVGTCMYMIWTALACLVHFVDSIIWNGNVINWAPVWCDICTFGYPFTLFFPHGIRSAVRIQIAVAVAWPACGLCITRSLYNITVTTTQIDVRYRNTFCSHDGH